MTRNMHFSQIEPQIVQESDNSAVIHNPLARSGNETAPVHIPRGVQTETTVWSLGRGRGLQFGRGRVMGRGAALIHLMQYINTPVVGESPSSSRESSLDREMPPLEPVERFIFEEVKRNWG